MTRTSTIIEKTIATILILWGYLLLYSTILLIYTLADFAITHHIDGWKNISFLTISKNYYLKISEALVTILGGIFLIFNKKVGWITSLIIALLNGSRLLFVVFKPNSLKTETPALTLSRIVGAILFFAFVFALTRRPFRLKYHIGANT
jgi:hypothetical protein